MLMLLPLNKALFKQSTKALLIHAGLFLLLGASAAYAQDTIDPKNKTLEQTITERVKNAEEKNYLSISYENDLIGGGTDEFYTSGLRVTHFNVNTDVPDILDRVANRIPTFDINETTSTFYSFGQNIYTPQDIGIAADQANDRPWAAWLYGSVGLATLERNHIDELEVTLGVVGPEALGEQTQKLVHSHITGSETPRGWSNQLDFEPGLILSWRRRWPWEWTQEFGAFRFRAEPNINVSLGNIYSYAGGGLNVQFGPDNGALQDTPPRVRPAMAGNGYFETPKSGWSWHLFAGVDGRLVGRNIFLDGNTFRDSSSVDKEYLVGDAAAGVAFTFDRYRLSYSYNYRSKEFKGQDDSSRFGSATLSTRF